MGLDAVLIDKGTCAGGGMGTVSINGQVRFLKFKNNPLYLRDILFKGWGKILIFPFPRFRADITKSKFLLSRISS